MDLSKFDTVSGSEEGRWIEPLGFNGAPIGIRIKVAGPDSRKYGALKDELHREMYASLANVSNGLEVKKDEPEDIKEAKFYAKLTLGWEPVDEKDPVTWEGRSFNFTEANAVILYTAVALVRNQVKAFCETRRNFTKPERGG